MKLYLGFIEGLAPHQTRIFAECENRLIDFSFAYAAYLTHQRSSRGNHELAGLYFPATIAAFLERGVPARRALDEVLAFVSRADPGDLRGPSGERIFYEKNEVRLVPPFQNPAKSFVIGLSDKARTEAVPPAEIPTGFYKLPQTFITTGASIVWPRFSNELDADACLAIVIGKAGKRIPPGEAWSHVAGVMLLIDITARDVNKREGLTTNNLLGKNFPCSTPVGPGFLPVSSPGELQAIEIQLSVNGSVKQKFTVAQCVFSIEQMIAHWSILGLKHGDFLAIGGSMTAEGERLGQPVPVNVGDILYCSSPAIGELSHQVVSAGGRR
jgi:2-keto-4-pentenoate hydratase/2-oxohepta-3-ene-1,7-dioic acid hydratase in catechol pathway